MAQLAIKGHPTRGNEVIELLEMLGGKLEELYLGNVRRAGYYINSNGHIDCMYYKYFDDTIIYTLESFLEKFPYKVGDKVLYKYDKKTYFIRKIFWKNDKILYELSDEVYSEGCSMPDTIIFDVDVIKLQPYKEETMEKIESFEIVENYCTDEVKIEFDPSKYEMVKKENGYYVVKKQPQYPKTYEECCKILHSDPRFYIDIYLYSDALEALYKLLICRDAYWKIAGEQMGLGKPWEPDYNKNPDIDLYVIINIYNRVEKATYGYGFQQCILTFPTEEMRDAFFENFKELIKECISLL